MMMKLHKTLLVLACGLTGLTPAFAEVTHKQYADDDLYVIVSGEDWHPEGFEHGKSVPAVYVKQADIKLDGKDDEPQWSTATEVTVPLDFGVTNEALVKALYTDDEIFFRVRWADDSEDREHHPWVWDDDQQKYEAGPQVEDSIILSFEAGCAWHPSLLAGYQYDFDGWRWLAARSDPVGQAWDLIGNVADQDHPKLKPIPYQSRNTENEWNVKFADTYIEGISHQSWSELDRSYLYRPVRPTSYVLMEVDGLNTKEVNKQLPAPQMPPANDTQIFPQYKPVKLEGDAGEVAAKGNWENGFWTVEFRRNINTPSKTLTDSVFLRLTQFSIHILDHTEELDQSSESDRLFLEFLPEEPQLTQD
jgi:hypothetical protein